MREFKRFNCNVLVAALVFAIAQAEVQAAVPTTDEEYERFLATAEIVAMKKIGTISLISKPRTSLASRNRRHYNGN